MFLLGNASLGRKRHIPLADWPEMPAAAASAAALDGRCSVLVMQTAHMMHRIKAIRRSYTYRY